MPVCHMSVIVKGTVHYCRLSW